MSEWQPDRLMLAIAYLGLIVLLGDAICRRWLTFVSPLHRLATAFLAGLVAGTWLTYAVSFAAGAFDTPLLAGDGFMLGVLGPVLVRERWPTWRAWWQTRLRTRGAAPRPDGRLQLPRVRGSGSGWDWITLAVVLAFVSWMMVATLQFDGAALRIGIHEIGDFGPNLALAQSFAVGHNFPTAYPLFAGEPILYHFLFTFQAGNLTFLGFDPATAFNVISIASMVAMLVLVMVLGRLLFGSAVVGRVAAVLFFFQGSLSFVPFLASFPSPGDALSALGRLDHFLSSGFLYRGEDWAIWTQNVFLNQRHLAATIGILLVAVIFVLQQLLGETRKSAPPVATGGAEGTPGPEGWRRRASDAARRVTADPSLPGYAVCGLLLGLLPLWNGAIYVASAALLAAMWLVLPRRRPLLVLALTAAAVSLPQVVYLRAGATGTGFSLFHWGYVVQDATVANVSGYLGFLFGPKLVLAAVALFLGTGLQRRFFLAITSLVAVTFLTQLGTDILQNHKFMTTWLILVNLYAADGFVRLWRASPSIRAHAIPRLSRRMAAAALALVIVTGGVIDLLPIRNDTPQVLAMNGDPLYEWVRAETDPRSVFLSDLYIHSPILRAGRLIYYGWPAYPLSLGYDMASRERTYRMLFTSRSPRDLVRTLQAERIDYVVFDDGLREGTFIQNLNEAVYRATFQVAFSDVANRYRHLVIYRVPTDPNAWRALPGAPPVDMFTGGAGTEPGRLDGPRGIASSRTQVYVADTENHRIQRFALDGSYLGEFGAAADAPGALDEPNGVGVDSHGNVFVADSATNRLIEYDARGGFLASWAGPDGGFYGPRDVAVGPDDTLYVLDQGHARVVSRSADGTVGTFGSFGEGDGQLNDPTGVAVGAGLVFVADPTNQRIAVFAPDGRFERSIDVPEWGEPFQYPDVLVAPDGRSIYASSPSTGEVLVFDLDGREIGSLTTPASDSLDHPSAMAARPGGGVFVVDFAADRVSIATP